MIFNSKIRTGGLGFLFLTLLLTACNNPYGDFGAKLDSSSWIDITQPGARPFVRVYDDNSSIEILVFEGEIDIETDLYGAVNVIRIVNNGSQAGEEARQDVQVIQGSYIMTGGSSLTVDLKKRYTVFYKDTGGGMITSSTQSESDLSETAVFTFDNSTPDQISVNGEDYYALDTIIDAVMTESDESVRAANIHSLYQIAGVFMPQSRIPGFGGAGMAGYTQTTEFGSLMNTEDGDHHMDLIVKMVGLNAVTTFDFVQASDLKPIVIQGSYENKANPRGSGTIYGTVSFTIEGSSGIWYCELDYNNVTITNTIASDGNYLLSVDGGDPVEVDSKNVNPGVMDFEYISTIIAGF